MRVRVGGIGPGDRRPEQLRVAGGAVTRHIGFVHSTTASPLLVRTHHESIWVGRTRPVSDGSEPVHTAVDPSRGRRGVRGPGWERGDSPHCQTWGSGRPRRTPNLLGGWDRASGSLRGPPATLGSEGAAAGRTFGLLVGLVAVLGMASTVAGESLTEQQVGRQIERRLSEDAFSNVNVSVQASVVRVSGTVPSLWAKEVAIVWARDLSAVTLVVSDLQIERAEPVVSVVWHASVTAFLRLAAARCCDRPPGCAGCRDCPRGRRTRTSDPRWPSSESRRSRADPRWPGPGR